jgi:hypothetical protein
VITLPVRLPAAPDLRRQITAAIEEQENRGEILAKLIPILIV